MSLPRGFHLPIHGQALQTIIADCLQHHNAWLSFLLLWQVMVLERRYGFAAMGRSRELMRGSLLRGLGILLAGRIIVIVVEGGARFVVGHVPLLGPIGEGIANSAGAAYVAAVAVILYFDIRCRKEAFDLEHLARLVAGPEGAAEVP